MRKNMKGFTLIELLAVIVILAVIALIATPIIMNVINDAKKGAARDGAYGVLKSVETAVAQKMVTDTSFNIAGKTCTLDADSCNIATPAITINIDVKGTKPKSGSIIFDATGKISSATVTMEGETTAFAYNGDKITN